MKLRIVGFRVSLATNKGPFGVTTLFDQGLNIIRAENTSGKSAIINGILYALGLEVLVGKRGVEAAKPVLWEAGDYDGQMFSVLESFVELEIANAAGETVTIRRYLAGDKDTKLIEVVYGPNVTKDQGNQYRVEPFFVGIEGSAQRERGFHYFLADFLDLDLPKVKRFKGEDVPLYVECIAPLMFIEQVRGWSGIQATLQQSFGIRNVNRLAVEYILNLDVIENEMRRIQINEEASLIREDWQGLLKSMSQIASQVGGRLFNAPLGPVTILPDDPWIGIPSEEEEMITLSDWLVEKRVMLIESSGEGKDVRPEDESLQKNLENREKELLVAQSMLAQLRSDMSGEEDELLRLQARFDFIKTDIRRNQDIKRLRNFGVDTGLSLIKDKCPTCNQNIQDSLIPTESAVMGVEENINFLKAEDEAVNLLISAGKERLSLLQSQITEKSRSVNNLRSNIRDLRTDLLGNQSLSIAAIREQVHLQEEVTRLEQARDDFEKQLGLLMDVAASWQGNRIKHSELPDEYFSDRDKKKLRALSESFSANAQKFGYRSTGMSKLHISEDNYRPVCDDFEVAFGASASDNIRLIWAYTLALLQVSSSYGGKHWGIIVFDEPEQQKMKEASSDALYQEIASMTDGSYQVIIATSAAEDVTLNRIEDLPHNLLEFGDKVVRPIE